MSDKPCILVGGGNWYPMTRVFVETGKLRLRIQVGKHRVVLEKKLGRPIKPGYFACHKCDNKNCIEPEHLFEGTHRDNTNDAIRKGRFWGRGNRKKKG